VNLSEKHRRPEQISAPFKSSAQFFKQPARRCIMKKNIIALMSAAVLSAALSTAVFAAETESEFYPTYEQTASAYLDQDGHEVKVLIDISDGFSAEFAHGAAYLYDGAVSEDTEPVAVGLTLDEDVFEEYIETASASSSYREFARSFAYTEEDGTNNYFFQSGPDAYFMVSVAKGADGDAISSRFSVIDAYEES
jgi:hypothetical protein